MSVQCSLRSVFCNTQSVLGTRRPHFYTLCRWVPAYTLLVWHPNSQSRPADNFSLCSVLWGKKVECKILSASGRGKWLFGGACAFTLNLLDLWLPYHENIYQHSECQISAPIELNDNHCDEFAVWSNHVCTQFLGRARCISIDGLSHSVPSTYMSLKVEYSHLLGGCCWGISVYNFTV